jgi:phage host-nuclease inhibitor protein Gam
MEEIIEKTADSQQELKETEQAFHEYAQSAATEKNLQASIEKQIANVKERFRPQLQECRETKRAAYGKLREYAQAHGELFSQKRSVNTRWGTLGYKMTPRRLRMSKELTYREIAAIVARELPDYVMQVPTINKMRLLADIDKPDVVKKLAVCGIWLERHDQFYVQLGERNSRETVTIS